VAVLDAIFAFEVFLGIEAEPELVRLPVRLADRTGVWLGFLRGGNTLVAALDAAQCDASAAGRVAASDLAMLVALVELEDYSELANVSPLATLIGEPRLPRRNCSRRCGRVPLSSRT
jgi:hypothetical protein